MSDEHQHPDSEVIPAYEKSANATMTDQEIMEQISAMRVAASVLTDRLQFMRQAGITFKGLRDLYEVLGYERKLIPANYRERFERGGIAGTAVDALPKATWRGPGTVYEDEKPDVTTKFETAWALLNQRIEIWPLFQRLDILSSLGHYGVLLIGAQGSWDTELPKARGQQDILYLTPFPEEDAKIEDYDRDTASPRFGRPTKYQLKRTSFDVSISSKTCHWTRVIHIAEGLLDDEVTGLPRLERPWNYFDDLEKVVGGGAEAFFQRANRGMQIDVDKKMAFKQEAMDALQKEAEEYEHGMRRIMRTHGVNIKDLGAEVADFKNAADAVITLIAGCIGIPKRILTGSELGELASTQDRDNWIDVVRDRRTSFAEPQIVRQFVNRLVQYGYLPTPKAYYVDWPLIQAMTEPEKIESARKAASVNDHFPGKAAITVNEIRERYFDLPPTPEGSDTTNVTAGTTTATTPALPVAARGDSE